jgi:hypothetical protein
VPPKAASGDACSLMSAMRKGWGRMVRPSEDLKYG